MHCSEPQKNKSDDTACSNAGSLNHCSSYETELTKGTNTENEDEEVP